MFLKHAYYLYSSKVLTVDFLDRMSVSNIRLYFIDSQFFSHVAVAAYPIVAVLNFFCYPGLMARRMIGISAYWAHRQVTLNMQELQIIALHKTIQFFVVKMTKVKQWRKCIPIICR